MNKPFEFKAVVVEYKNQFREEGYAHRFLGCTLTLEIDKMWPGGNGTFVGTLTLPDPVPPVCPFCGEAPEKVVGKSSTNNYLRCITPGCIMLSRLVTPEGWYKRA